MAPREPPSDLVLDNSHHDDSSSKNGNDAPILMASRHLLKPNGSIVGDEIARAILPLFPTLLSAIPTTAMNITTTTTNRPHPALATLDGRQTLTHERIVEFGQYEFSAYLQNIVSSSSSLSAVMAQHSQQQSRKLRIGLILPNGPELAMALLVTAHYCTAVPLNANAPSSEWEVDLAQCGADLVVGMFYEAPQSQQQGNVSTFQQQDWSSFRSVHDVANKLCIPYCGLIPSTTEAGIFRLVPYFQTTGTNNNGTMMVPFPPNGHDDPALILFTSGTTGQKKLVPHVLGDLVTAATTIALSWNLQRTDVNCNMMPLFHIGGIVRQVLSPIFSGGCVICCPNFDPTVFWTLMEKRAFTWYYAAPTMHQLILQTGKDDGYIMAKRPGESSSNQLQQHNNHHMTLRMIANAAGGLLPSLAEELKQTFQANVSVSDVVLCFKLDEGTTQTNPDCTLFSQPLARSFHRYFLRMA
jgi:acyl-CoA synthetase (AMP-forming)/AMP-acid ligase II